MAITVNQASSPNSFESTHIMHLKTFDNREHITLSGIAKIELRNERDETGIKMEELKIILNLSPILPSDKWFKLEQGVPMVTLNSFQVTHGSTGIDRGFYGFEKGIYVDTFSIDRNGASWGIGLKSSIGVLFEESVLHRVSYYVSMIGTFEDAVAIQ
jgi:hypothetical protein